MAAYACETWTLRKKERDKLNALEMWVWRRMEKVSWMDKKKNEQVLREVGEERRLLQSVEKEIGIGLAMW